MNSRWLSALAPLPAILAGILIGHAHGISIGAYAPNLIGLFVGLITLGTFGRSTLSSFNRNRRLFSVMVLALIALSFAFEGVDGVHRWISLGKFKLNVSQLLLPLALYLVFINLERDQIFGMIFIAAVAALLVAQPDAGQMTAFGGAAAIIFLTVNQIGLRQRFIGISAIVIFILVGWLRPDSVLPIDHVERVFQIASNHGALLLTAAIASACFAIFGLTTFKTSNLFPTMATYLVLTFLVPFLGNFPVPLLGAGASTVIGWYSAVVLLSNERAQRDVK